MSRGAASLFGQASPASRISPVSPLSPVSKGALRFFVLLAAACLVGALVGVLTEPVSGKAKPGETASRAPETALDAAPPAAAVAGEASPPAATFATKEATATGSAALDALAPDLRGLWFAAIALLGFALVAVLIARRARAARASSGVVHLVDSLVLGAGRSVHLLRCEGRKYLIGSSERGIAFLASLPQNESERALDHEAEPLVEGEPAFEHVLYASGATANRGGAPR